MGVPQFAGYLRICAGNVQRLPNGNTLILWGTANVMTEVRPNGAKALELLLSPLFTVHRTFRFPWMSTDVDRPAQSPATVSLLPVYPNTCNATATVQYQLPKPDHVTLRIFDILGREVATPVNGFQEPGEKTVRFDAGNLSSGMYFCQLRVGGFVDTRKILLLK